jgi:hypothetical protein
VNLLAGNFEHIFVFNKLRRINKPTLSMKSVLAVKTGFMAQLWHSFCECGFLSKSLLSSSLTDYKGNSSTSTQTAGGGLLIHSDPFALIYSGLFC